MLLSNRRHISERERPAAVLVDRDVVYQCAPQRSVKFRCSYLSGIPAIPENSVVLPARLSLGDQLGETFTDQLHVVTSSS